MPISVLEHIFDRSPVASNLDPQVRPKVNDQAAGTIWHSIPVLSQA
jgi:hypothetical protein